MKVQIVVPCINLWKQYTEQCLDSVKDAMLEAEKHGIETRILLIDNASTDETSIEASKLVSDTFAHKRNEEMWGFQRSVNYGINDAFEREYDIAMVINNDVIMHKNSIWRIVERFKEASVFSEKSGKDNTLGMVTCMDIRGETTPENFKDVDDKTKEGVSEAPYPNFSAFAINKKCWDTVGEFDELFHPAYYEDNCFHYRMKLAGINAIVYPPALFYHYGSRTQNEALRRPLTDSGNQYKRYISKWGGDPGNEKFTHPFDNKEFSIKYTKQSIKT